MEAVGSRRECQYMFADDANTCDGRTGVECHQPPDIEVEYLVEPSRCILVNESAVGVENRGRKVG
jgi:hypothetical protein